MDELFTQMIEFSQALRASLWETWETEYRAVVTKHRFPKLLYCTARISKTCLHVKWLRFSLFERISTFPV